MNTAVIPYDKLLVDGAWICWALLLLFILLFELSWVECDYNYYYIILMSARKASYQSKGNIYSWNPCLYFNSLLISDFIKEKEELHNKKND